MLHRAAARLPEHADAVRVVDDDHGVMRARELEDLRKLREVAFHREDAVGDDQLAQPRAARLRARRAAPHVRVRVDDLATRAETSRTASMMLAWLSSSVKITVTRR